MAKMRVPVSRKTIYKWNLKMLCELIIEIVHNKFDCFIIVEGKRGLGKSTLAYEILSRVSRYMKLSDRENKDYIFRPKKDILYSQQDVLNAVTKRKYDSFLADELIAVTFNRDFYSESQKKIIKSLNMYRDSCNLIVSCVPQFATLDNQIRNLCRIRITVVRRGLAIVHTPNKTIYSKDIWDTQLNEKIERGWIGKFSRPKYSRLTTFRGILKFPDLRKSQRELYEEIKFEKRNEIIVETDKPKEETPTAKVHRMLDEGTIKTREEFTTSCIALDLKPINTQKEIWKRLKNEGRRISFKDYFKEGYVQENMEEGERIPSVLR